MNWVTQSIGAGSEVVSVRALPSSWLANHAVDVVDRHGTTHALVLRRWARPGWEIGDPEMTAAHEAGVLELLADSPVPAPDLVAADPDADVCDVPTLLITRVSGQPPPTRPRDRSSFLKQLAAALPAIHALDHRGLVHPYSHYYEPERLRVPTQSERPELWERAIEVFDNPVPDTETCFIHRDYHPGNTLWSDGRLAGIVDWTAASVGSPAIDLAHMRLNLARDVGLEAADEFAAHHRRIAGQSFEYQPYWDVVDAADALPELDRTELPAIERYLADALARL
ncbi:MAG TPA: phosphotransferase [Acidimicrobiia bacterium]|nr:phosphotransferase [Acidimicrobiia bacterium]